MRRIPRIASGKSNANPNVCICAEKLQASIVAGTAVQGAPFTSDVNASIACSVVAAIKHIIAPVCTWKREDVDDIWIEGCQLVRYITKARQDTGSKDRFCRLIGQHTVFGQKWKVNIGMPVYTDFGLSEGEAVLYEKLQEHLLRDGMCLLDLHTAVSLIIHHKNYFVVVDCGTRNAAGLASEIGTAVAVFNTCLDDLMLHIRNLQKSLDAQWYAVSSISVQVGQADADVESSAVFVDRDVDTNLTAKVDNTSLNLETVNAVTGVEAEDSCCIIKSVRGSFHQADDGFKYGGLQCMAIGLVSLAKHKVDSVFSWETKDLDRVVVLGDLLYTNLRDCNMISNSSSVLCVPDLPKSSCIDGQNFEFEYGDFVSGDVDVLEGEHIENGVYTTLQTGLPKICAMYNTCLLTLCGSTCAVISENGQYALVDSHARSAVGLVSEQGRSVVLCFRSLEDVFRHICQLATGLSQKQKPFEVAGVCVRYLVVSDSATPKDSCEKTCKTFTPESSCDSIQNEPNISDVIIVESLIEAESCKASGKTMTCSEYDLGLLCNDATRKRKISVGHSEAKKLKQYDVSQVNSDVEFVSEVINNKLVFSPISELVCQALCTQLNVEFEKISVPASTCVGLLGVPYKKKYSGRWELFLQSYFSSCDWHTKAPSQDKICHCERVGEECCNI